MPIGLTSSLGLLVTSGTLIGGLGWYAWKYRSLPGAATFAIMVPLTALWALGAVGELLAGELHNKLIWANIQYFPIAFVPVCWLVLSIGYAGRRQWLTARRLLALCLIPLATQALLWTDGYHHLVRASVWLDTTQPYTVVGRTFGTWFWVHYAYSYALVGFAIVLIAATIASTPYFYRRWPLSLLIGCLIPVAWNVAFVFAPSFMPAFDFTPVATTLGGLIVAWGVLRLRLVDLAPTARRTVVENLSDGMLVLDDADRVVDLNRSAQELIGRPRAAIVSHPIDECWDAWRRMAAPHVARTGQADLRLGEAGTQRYYGVQWSPLVRRSPLLHRDQTVGRIVEFRDITERVLMEENLRHQTLTDGLTGLANRTLFMARLEDALHLARRSSDTVFAVVMLDLDWFKRINDSVGHLAGDMLLQSVATKLKRCVREVDTVARMGGDEFIILLNSIRSASELFPLLGRVQQELRSPVYFHDQPMSAACSIGIVIWNAAFTDPEDLVRAADTAMYQAKEAGRGCVRVFDEEMQSSVVRTREAEDDLRTAIQQHDFSLAYQPIVDLRTGAVHSLEALVRWHHPERGTVFPGDFIAMAESSGLIAPLGEMALKEVGSQMSQWQSSGSPAATLMVSLNVSPRQITDPAFPAALLEHLASWNIPTERLGLDITETALVSDPLTSKHALQALRDTGIRLCLDDFGTGWSSLQHLMTFPVHQLKIDQAFISKIAPANTWLQVVSSLISLAHALGLEVTAEGIETGEQWQLLQASGCDYGQGYCIGRPMPANELLTYLEHIREGSRGLPKLANAPAGQETRAPTTQLQEPAVSMRPSGTPLFTQQTP